MIGDCSIMLNVTIQYLNNYNLAEWGPLRVASKFSAGFDLRAAMEEDYILLTPGERYLIKTGIKTSFDAGYEAQVRARSGLALKQGLGLANGIGTIDADYRDEWGVILVNHGEAPLAIHRGDRIAQVVFNQLPQVNIMEGIVSDNDNRGGGFGSSGVK